MIVPAVFCAVSFLVGVMVGLNHARGVVKKELKAIAHFWGPEYHAIKNIFYKLGGSDKLLNGKIKEIYFKLFL